MLQELIRRGLAFHQAGQLAEAKALYEQALALRPEEPEALHLLGVVALQQREFATAIALISRALSRRSQNAGYLLNLGHAYFETRQLEEARAAFERAAKLAPQEPRAAMGAANCRALEGRLAEAEARLRKLVQRHPGFAPAWFNLGNAVRDQGRPAEAARFYRRAADLEPRFVDAFNNLGNVLHLTEQMDEAEAAFRECVRLDPDYLTGYCNLASVLIDRGKFAEAEALCRQALARDPRCLGAQIALGAATGHQGRLTDALACFEQAAALAPQHPRAIAALGNILGELGRNAEAHSALTRALALDPDNPEGHYSFAVLALRTGDFAEGWGHFQWRAARQRLVKKHSRTPLALELPENLAGRSVCLLREQGLGDELFFLRYARALRARGARTTYCSSAKLASLVARAGAVDRVLDQPAPRPESDYHVLIGDLPLVVNRPPASPFKTRSRSRRAQDEPLAGFVRGIPTLHRVFHPELPAPLPLVALDSLVEEIRAQLAELGPPPYLGVTWRGGTSYSEQRGAVQMLYKEVPLAALARAVRDVKGTLLIFQRHPQAEEIEMLRRHLQRPLHDLSALNEDLERMLALLAVADDYVGVSNTNMHLRAGVGKTARVLVPCPAEWRWMATGDESPWFPGFRIYRQGPDGDWSAALDRLAQDLRAKFGARKQ